MKIDTRSTVSTQTAYITRKLLKRKKKTTPKQESTSHRINSSCLPKLYDHVQSFATYSLRAVKSGIENNSNALAGMIFFSYAAYEIEALEVITVRSVVPISNAIMSLVMGTALFAKQFMK